MRPGSAALADVLAGRRGGTFSFKVVADVFYDGERTFKDLPVTDVRLKWDAEADLKSAAELVVDYGSTAGESLTPTDFSSTLAPYGQEVNLIGVVTAGAFTESIQLGRYRIFADPNASDQTMDFQGRKVAVSSHVEVTLTDLMVVVKRAGFRFAQNPSTTSAWDELATVTGMPVIRNLPDVTLASTLAYEANEGGRLKAVQSIANLLGGVPYTNPYGAVTIIPDVHGPIVAQLVLGENGTVLDSSTSLTSEDVFNCIVGQFEDVNRKPITAVAAKHDGPLDVDGPYGEYTKYVSNDNVKTVDAADAYVKAELTRATTTQTYRVPVRCVVNPLIEIGDVVSVPNPATGADLVGRVATCAFGLDGYMDIDVDVVRAVGG